MEIAQLIALLALGFGCLGTAIVMVAMAPAGLKSPSRDRLRHARVRLDPAVLGIVADPPSGHFLGGVGPQQLGPQGAGLEPLASRLGR